MNAERVWQVLRPLLLVVGVTSVSLVIWQLLGRDATWLLRDLVVFNSRSAWNGLWPMYAQLVALLVVLAMLPWILLRTARPVASGRVRSVLRWSARALGTLLLVGAGPARYRFSSTVYVSDQTVGLVIAVGAAMLVVLVAILPSFRSGDILEGEGR